MKTPGLDLSGPRCRRLLSAVVFLMIFGARTAARSQAEAGPWPQTELVSRTADGEAGSLPSFEATPTANGRVVYFTSYATNFVPVRKQGLRIFRHEMQSGLTIPVPTEGTDLASPAVSANGRYLAYVSTVDHTQGGRAEIFVRDMRSGRTVLASRADGPGGAPAAAPPKYEYLPSVARPSLSANGRYLAFVSTSPSLFPGSWRDRVPAQIYVRDLVKGTTTLVSRASGRHGALADAPCAEPEISADGRHVVFTTSARNLGLTAAPGGVFEGNVFVRDLTSAKTTAVSSTRLATTSYSPAISADGHHVAFFRKGPHVAPQVFERDLLTGKTVLVSRASGSAGAPAESFGAKSFLGISADGGSVGFFSDARNLGGPPAPGGSAGEFGLYLRDLGTASTTFVHWEGWGRPRFAGGGRYLVFGTFDTDQPAPNGAYATGQIYRYGRGPTG